MGQSTNGQICYGILFEEREFPWDSEFDGDIDDWWLHTLGFKSSVEILDSEGQYLSNIPIAKREELVDLWYKERTDFRDSHDPMPIELVNVCSGDYPIYILAVPSSIKTASRGYPTSFNPRDLEINIGDVIALEKFCERFKLVGEGKPSWYLSSYMG